MTIDCATLSQSELLRPFNCLYTFNFHRWLSDTIIGQGSLLLLPLSCWLKAVFLVNSRHSRFYAPLIQGLILANLLRHFAEFLKDTSSFTLVFSTSSLVLDWYSSFTRFFLIFLPRPFVPFWLFSRIPITIPIRVMLRACFIPTLNISVIFHSFLILVTHNCIVAFNFLWNVLLPFSYLVSVPSLATWIFGAFPFFLMSLLRVLSLLAVSKPTFLVSFLSTYLTHLGWIYDLNIDSGFFPFWPRTLSL